MTTNLVVGINAALLKTRRLPISSVFSAIFYRCQGCNGCKPSDGEVDECRSKLTMSSNVLSYGDYRSSTRRFQTLHYLCAHVVATCAKVSLNVEQFVDDVYTLKCMLHVWENEFPILPDLSTWEVPPMTFELVQDKGLGRNPKGRSQSSRIHNEVDIREKSDLRRLSVVDPVYHLGPMKLISETDDAIIGGSKHFIIYGYISARVDIHVVGDFGDQHPFQSQVGVCKTWRKNHMPRMPSMNLSREECYTTVDTTQEEWSNAVDTGRSSIYWMQPNYQSTRSSLYHSTVWKLIIDMLMHHRRYIGTMYDLPIPG
ncbi:hypothetical protein GOBAR_DD02742 [Gossypium barbadense]|nr:hypothetical protein GOBAR_DD02742 [Gossypium barbadense]